MAETRRLPLSATFYANGVTFRYPTAWRLQRLTEVSSFTSLLATMSTRQVPEPCHHVPHGFDCGPLLTSLSAGDVLVSWVQEGMPGLSLARQPGEAIVVDDHPGRLLTTRSGSCPPGTAAEIDGVISLTHSPSHDELLRMTACAGASAARAAAPTAQAMLRAVRFDPKAWPRGIG